VRVGVAYVSPTREVVPIMTEALDARGRILKQPDPVVLFEDFGDSALLFSAYFWAQASPIYDYRIIESNYRTCSTTASAMPASSWPSRRSTSTSTGSGRPGANPSA
jgi:small-conductance mechanosensitive channel